MAAKQRPEKKSKLSICVEFFHKKFDFQRTAGRDRGLSTRLSIDAKPSLARRILAELAESKGEKDFRR